MIELVVFDMAGTTVEDGNAVNASFQAALSSAGVDVDSSSVNAVMGLAKPEAIRLLLAGAGREVSDAEADAIHADFVRRMCKHYASDPAVREVPGAAAVFSALRHGGIKVALNTGFSRKICSSGAVAPELARPHGDRRRRGQRRSAARPASSRHDLSLDGPTGHQRSAPSGQSRRYKGRPGRRDQRWLWSSHRRDHRHIYARKSTGMPPHAHSGFGRGCTQAAVIRDGVRTPPTDTAWPGNRGVVTNAKIGLEAARAPMSSTQDKAHRGQRAQQG